MRKILLFVLMSLSLAGCKCEKTVVNCHDMAVTVTNKALETLPLGHYAGVCLYSGMADVVLACGDTQMEQRLTGIIDKLVSGEIDASGGSFICYNIGGQAVPYLVFNGYGQYKAAVEANAADMWERQYRTADNLMTGNTQKDRFRDCIWIDCAFAVSTYLLYAGLSTGNQDYIEYAAFYALKLWEIFRDPATGLVFQARSYANLADGEISTDHWSRGQGWLSMAFVSLLRDYPADGPRRKEIEAAAKDFYTAVLKYQDADGVWHQELPNFDSFVETSGTALLLAGIGQAVESGILPKCKKKAFLKGLGGLMAYVDPDGSIGHTCMGNLAPGKGTPADYEIRHFYFNERHAFGPVVLALTQAVRLGIEEFSVPGRLGEKNDAERPRACAMYAESRKGDVAWENDFCAYRVYSLQVAEKSQALSGVDMWPKSVDYSIIDKRYAEEAAGLSYHIDRGEGCDFYAMGAGRGIGGTGVWTDGKLWTSRNYSKYEILSAGPDRASFILEYEPYQAGAVSVTERKRIDIICGTPFYRIESTLSTSDGSPVTLAVGLTNFGAATVAADPAKGKLFLQENLQVKDSTVHLNGQFSFDPAPEIYGAVVAEPAAVKDILHYGKDELVLVKAESGKPVVTYAGAVWKQTMFDGGTVMNEVRFGKIVDNSDWEALNKLYE